MGDLTAILAERILTVATGEGFHASPVPGVTCIKVSKCDARMKRRWRACLAVVVQGSKEIVFGRRTHQLGATHFTATLIDLPVVSRVAAASPANPFLCLLIDLDPSTLGELATHAAASLPSGGTNRHRALFVGEANERMLKAVLRLTELFQTPEDAPTLGPWIVRELMYHLVRGPNGPGICQFVRSGSKTHRVHQAVYAIHSSLGDDVDVAALAKAAGLSRSAFFQHFRAVTSLSPIQYQKRLRLLEARRLMVDEGETAERSSYRVGYRSASQFSREYSRMFGSAPRRDVDRFKQEKRVLGPG